MSSKAIYRPSKLAKFYAFLLWIMIPSLFIFVGWIVHGTIFPFKEEWEDAVNGHTNIYWAAVGLFATILWYIKVTPRIFSTIILSHPCVVFDEVGISIDGSITATRSHLRDSSFTIYHPYAIADFLIISFNGSDLKIDCTFLDTNSSRLKNAIQEFYDLRK